MKKKIKWLNTQKIKNDDIPIEDCKNNFLYAFYKLLYHQKSSSKFGLDNTTIFLLIIGIFNSLHLRK